MSAAPPIIRKFAAPFRRAIDLVLPPRCPGCGTITQAPHQFCADCWSSLRMIGPPWCASCALPFEFDRGEGAQCAACQADPPRHSGVRASVSYGDVTRRLALALKYGGRMGHAETMARLMARLMPEDVDLLVPVPLHRWRLWSRGFNQALLIAQALERIVGIRAAPDMLVRTRSTPSLRGLGRRQRAKAVRGAFAVPPHRRAAIAGRVVVLVDDVYTTGSTADACTRALLSAGAIKVTILCWARVIDDTAVA